MRSIRLLELTILFLLLLVLGPSKLSAQIGGGSIVGFVTDPSNAAVSGAAVHALNVETNIKRETVTNERGYYEFPLLPAGKYRLEAELAGFQRAVSGSLTLNSGTRPRIDLKLALGEVTQSVEVVSSAPLVNVTTTDLGVVMERAKVESLPLNGRNWQQLIELQAGVLNSSGVARGGMQFYGASALGNNLMLDGVDMSAGENSSATSTRSSGTIVINTVSLEGIQEFKTTGNAFSAEYGRAVGGVVNIVTKSGTNDFHGTLFHYFRNDKLDANDFFSNRSGLGKPPLRWNQFGGNLGGPIRRDKLFFFSNYEGVAVRRNQAQSGNVPTPLLLDAVTPALRQALGRLPKTFEPTTNPYIGFHRRNDRSTVDEQTILNRVDWNLGSHQVAGRYGYNRQDSREPDLLEGVSLISPLRLHNAVLQDAWSVSPSLLNEFRFGVNRVDMDRRQTGVEGIPASAQTAGVNLNLTLAARLHAMADIWTVADNFTVIKGRHTMKTGFEYRKVNANRFQDNAPLHYYNSLNDLIADRTNRFRVTFGGLKPLGYSTFGVFVQDDFRLNSRLQLNMGLRYEYFPPLRGAFNITSSNPFGSFGRNDEGMTRADRNDFGPRLGLVYNALGNQKLVIRAGGGVSYAPPIPDYYYGMAFLDPRIPFNPIIATADLPRGVTTTYPLDASFVPSVKQNPSLLPASLVLSRSILDYNARDEYAMQWNLSVQSAITSQQTVQISYAGNRGLKASGLLPVNLIDPATGRRPDPSIGDIYFRENAGRLTYHALQLSANRRMSKGLTFDVYYTFAKTLSYCGSDTTATTAQPAVQDPNNIAGSYGPKIGEVRHRLTGVFAYELPATVLQHTRAANAILGGWSVQGIIGRRSGQPINVLSGRDFVGNGRVEAQRPDIIARVNPYVREDLVWLNRAAFDLVAPLAQRRFGNLGYNALRGPSAFTFDSALHKRFQIREKQYFTFRFEMFNALNHPVMGDPNNTVSNPTFGSIQSASGGRNIQLALKYTF